MVDFDYVIVGAGAAGCVLASRLSEDPGNQVLLLEYGGRDANPLLYVPEGFYFTLRGVNFLGYQIRPTTTSSVHLSGRLPGNPPVITARFLDDDADRQATAPVLGIARQLFGKGPDASDVVDPQLRVRGVTGLRVVDASVLPVQVAGNTQAPAMAVAWIAADLILEDS